MYVYLQVMTKFSELSEVMFKRHEQEADTMYATQRFTWVNNIHKHGLYDMPILGWSDCKSRDMKLR